MSAYAYAWFATVRMVVLVSGSGHLSRTVKTAETLERFTTGELQTRYVLQCVPCLTHLHPCRVPRTIDALNSFRGLRFNRVFLPENV